MIWSLPHRPKLLKKVGRAVQKKRAHRLVSPFTIYSLVSYRQTKIVGQLAQEGIDKGKADKANDQT